MKFERYVIVDTRTTCGNSVFFWCYDGSGYTCDLRMAMVLTKEKVALWTKRETDKIFKYSDVLKLVQHHVDCQDLYRKEIPKTPHTYSHLNAPQESESGK